MPGYLSLSVSIKSTPEQQPHALLPEPLATALLPSIPHPPRPLQLRLPPPASNGKQMPKALAEPELNFPSQATFYFAEGG